MLGLNLILGLKLIC